jgi:hypothetical protein
MRHPSWFQISSPTVFLPSMVKGLKAVLRFTPPQAFVYSIESP